MRLFKPLILVLALSYSCFAKTFILGIVPQQSQLVIAKDWMPIIQYLHTTTGDTFVLKTEVSIPEFEKVLYSGGYDIAYMNPYHYVIAHKKVGYIPSVRSDKDLTGIVVVKKESPYDSVAKLKGKKFLFPAPDAFAATLLVKYELHKFYGIDLEKEKQYSYVNSHDSVYKGVARDIGDAGGGIERTFNDLSDNETKNALKVLHRTKSYPSHPIAFNPKMNKLDRDKITKALLAMPPELLNSLQMKRLIPIQDSDYNNVRDIATILHSK